MREEDTEDRRDVAREGRLCEGAYKPPLKRLPVISAGLKVGAAATASCAALCRSAHTVGRYTDMSDRLTAGKVS
jgi:hypothetical protein